MGGGEEDKEKGDDEEEEISHVLWLCSQSVSQTNCSPRYSGRGPTRDDKMITLTTLDV